MTGLFDRFRHGKLRELLSSYIDDEVSDSERRRVERHLSRCEECRQELESLRLTVAALRQLPEVQTTRSFAISTAPEQVRGGFGWVLGVRLAASAAAVVLVGLILADVTGLLIQADLSDWTAISDRAESEAPAQPAAPAPAAPAPAPAAAPAAPTQPAAPAAAPAPTAAPAAAPAPAAPAPAAAPAAAMMADTEPTQVPTPEPSMESQVAAAEPSPKEAVEAMADSAMMAATSSPEATPVTAATATLVPTVTASPTPMATATATPTPEPTNTPAPTSTPTPTPVPTATQTPSPTPTITPAVPPTQAPAGDLDSTGREQGSRPAIPLRQLEIALGILLVALVCIGVCVSRRQR